MNDAWRQADAEAHQAKAEALGHASDALEGALDVLDANGARLAGQMQLVLLREAERHTEAAKLVAA